MRTLTDPATVQQLIEQLGGAIGEAMAQGDASGWALVGVRSRGDVLARRLGARLPADQLGERVGSLDITLYRDDLSEIGPQAVVRTTEVPFAIDGLNVVLVDDVIMTGRSVRAALTSLMDLGRPRRVWLAVLVDRGGRELPIAPDFVGLDLSQRRDPQLGPSDQVQVWLEPADESDAIVLEPAPSVSRADG